MALPTTVSGWARALLVSFVTGIALASFLPGMSLEALAKWEQLLLPLFCIVLVGVFILGKRNATEGRRPSRFVVGNGMKRKSIILVALVVVMFGVVRYQLALPDTGEGSVTAFIGSDVTVEGVVSDEVKTSGQMQSLTLDEIVINEKPVLHKLLARVPLYPEFSYGDRVRLSCALEAPEPFDGFRYDRYLAKEGVLVICQSYREPFSLGQNKIGLRGRLLEVKSSIIKRIRLTFHEPYAALLEGLLLGEKNLSDSVEEDFRKVGLSHIIAASGQNVVLMTDALFWLFIGIGFHRRGTGVLLLGAIVVYVLLAGADAAIVRAGIMGSVVVLAKILGRVPSTMNILLFVLALMLFHNPLLLRDDIGFQLSFAATTGLLILQPRLSQFFTFLPRAIGIREAVSTSVAAIVATLPIMALSFGQISLVAPIANMIILPIIPFVMIAGAVILGISALSQPLALILAAPVVGGLEVMLGSAHLLARLPFAAADVAEMTWVRILLCVGALFLLRWIFLLKVFKQDEGHRLSPSYFFACGLLLVVPVLPDLLPSSRFQAMFFSVGQGDATFLQLDSGERWLIDGGPDDTVLVKLGQVLPWYDRRIDVLVPTHADADHITGLIEVSRRYDIGRVYLSADDVSLKMQLLKSFWKNTPIEFVSAGQNLSVEGTTIRVLSPSEGFISDDRNELSTVLLVENEGRRFLFTGDASQERERVFVNELDHLDVYKAGHHGSYTSTSYELVSATTPDVAIISSGKDNRYGHPHGVVLERLRETGSHILRTDTDGDIEIGVSEGKLKLRTNRLWY